MVRLSLILLFSSLFIVACTPPDIPDINIEYVWVGSVTDSSALFAIKLNHEGDARMAITSDSSFKKGIRYSEVSRVKEMNYLTIQLKADSLKPNTTYFYRAELDGQELHHHRLEGKFKTFPNNPSSYKIAFASCARTGSESRIFQTIANLDPLFYMNTGDLHYENINGNCDYEFAEAIFEVQKSHAQSALYRSTAFVYMWDDHDFGPNNSASDASCRNESIKSYKKFIPHYPLAFSGLNQPVSQAFDAGRVRYVLTDLRSHKERPEYDGCERTKEGSNFGTKRHLKWFKETLLKAKKDSMLVAWVSGIPWISSEKSRKYQCNEKDEWGGYEEERKDIANFIKENSIPICILSGDAHIVAIDDGSNSDYADGGGAPIPVFHAAPLDNWGIYKGGPYSKGYRAKSGQFGLMEIIDRGGSEICIQWTALDKYGNTITSSTKELLKYRFCKRLY